MTVNQLCREPIKYIIDGEMIFLPGHLRIKKYLQKQIAEFSLQLTPIAIVDGLKNFVSLFERVGFDGIECLLAVPGAPARPAQPGHDGDRALEEFACSWHHKYRVARFGAPGW